MIPKGQAGHDQPARPDSQSAGFRSGDTLTLIPDQSATVAGGLTITHQGYGHKITQEGDESFLQLRLVQDEKSKTMRFWTRLREPAAEEWDGWVITILACEDAGPPHSKEDRTILTAVRKAEKPSH